MRPDVFRRPPASNPAAALTAGQNKSTETGLLVHVTKIPRFQLRSLSASSNEQPLVTPPEVPSPPSEKMDSPTYEIPSLPGTTEARLAEIEARLVRREAKIDQTLDSMSQTLALLVRAVTPNSPATSQVPLPSTTPTRTRSDLKPALPTSFDGDCQKGKGFINACQAYFRLLPDQFTDTAMAAR